MRNQHADHRTEGDPRVQIKYREVQYFRDRLFSIDERACIQVRERLRTQNEITQGRKSIERQIRTV